MRFVLLLNYVEGAEPAAVREFDARDAGALRTELARLLPALLAAEGDRAVLKVRAGAGAGDWVHIGAPERPLQAVVLSRHLPTRETAERLFSQARAAIGATADFDAALNAMVRTMRSEIEDPPCPKPT